ncbi:MAG TPA: IS4 family transposase [Blastocatellia bacterium]|nr:IS4 family transposase [Blastocatellia bacterium]
MMTTIQNQTPREWAVTHFGGAELSDVRRVDRVVTIAEAMAASPGKALPQLFAHPYDLKAAYTFFRHPEATPDNVQAGHRERVLCEMEQPGRYLLLEDTSEVRCTETGDILGLGPLGASKKAKIGFHLHSVLAVRWPAVPKVPAPHRPLVEILGVADQQSHVREPRPEAVKPHASLRRVWPAAQLESSLWEKAARRLGRAPDRADVAWIKVGDRGADIFDHLVECQRHKQHFIIRARQDRVLLTAQGQRAGRLFETVRAAPSCGALSLDLRARPGQAARRAHLQVSFTPLVLRAPQSLTHSPGARPSLSCVAVRVWEPYPPPGSNALEWILLTDLEVTNFTQACEIVQMYATRWLEEEFHKALKTGMEAEGSQLKTAPAWFSIVAIKSVAALRLIEMRERLRVEPAAPAETAGLNELELAVLRARSHKSIETVAAVALAIGRLGGHLNRKSDGPPGWITLWRGWEVLQTLVEGVLLARKLPKFG